MAKYLVVAPCFIGGILYQAGETLEHEPVPGRAPSSALQKLEDAPATAAQPSPAPKPGKRPSDKDVA
jgi:hypothetical protein